MLKNTSSSYNGKRLLDPDLKSHFAFQNGKCIEIFAYKTQFIDIRIILQLNIGRILLVRRTSNLCHVLGSPASR